jgi:hypothetical protein
MISQLDFLCVDTRLTGAIFLLAAGSAFLAAAAFVAAGFAGSAAAAVVVFAFFVFGSSVEAPGALRLVADFAAGAAFAGAAFAAVAFLGGMLMVLCGCLMVYVRCMMGGLRGTK